MAKITNAVEPILTDMMDYLTFRSLMEKKNEMNEEKKKYRTKTIDSLVIDFIKNASRYYRNSKVTYPYLSIKDILFDQKGLKVHFKHTSLIYEGLALHKNTNSLELDLSTCPTPSAIDF
jgi:predicted nucleotide-binding protein (sugar kinase/HSP70/actin superfamily)